MELPPGFINQIKELKKIDSEKFFDSLSDVTPVSIRLNVRKPGVTFPEMEPVKWCDNAFYLPERPEFIFDPLLHAGTYYVQEASSTIYETVTKILVSKLCGNPLKVLDSCAAPGGKTTAMINGLPDGSFVWANEFVNKRVPILKENLTKWGYPHIKITNLDTSFFSSGDNLFDIVAVDAPCSGEGMMRKDEFAVKQWSPELVEKCATLQKEILSNISEAVSPGGFLIYSTCTFNSKENEENARFIIDSLGFETVDLSFPDEWGVLKGFDSTIPSYRFMPHVTRGEGLFLAVFRKPGKWAPSPQPFFSGDNFIKNKASLSRKDKKVKSNKPGVSKSGDKDDESKIDLVLSSDFDSDSFPSVNLSYEDSIAFLRGESIVLGPDIPKGIVVVKYSGHPLGTVKNIGSRANNLYPKPWRIKKTAGNISKPHDDKTA